MPYMSLDIDVGTVTAVLLADGWHEVAMGERRGSVHELVL